MQRQTRNHRVSLSRVRAVIAGLTLSGSVSLEMVATELGTSPRTLQRRLGECGVKFGKIVEETRLGIAGALLRETELSVREIADTVGYSTQGGFARAFGRWAGKSPSAYRRIRLLDDQDWREMGRVTIGSALASLAIKK